MSVKTTGVIHFIDGTSLQIQWERKKDPDLTTFISRIKKAIEKDRFIFEVDGDLMIIPVQNIKYFNLTPLPQALPEDLVIQGASIIG